MPEAQNEKDAMPSESVRLRWAFATQMVTIYRQTFNRLHATYYVQSRIAAVRILLREKSVVPLRRSSLASRLSYASAIRPRCETGATPPITLAVCGWP
jgi:hypothetical protein